MLKHSVSGKCHLEDKPAGDRRDFALFDVDHLVLCCKNSVHRFVWYRALRQGCLLLEANKEIDCAYFWTSEEFECELSGWVVVATLIQLAKIILISATSSNDLLCLFHRH
jgi:hypothetical protein